MVSAHLAIAWTRNPCAPSGFEELGWDISRIGMGTPVGAKVDIKGGCKESANYDNYDYLDRIISGGNVSGGE